MSDRIKRRRMNGDAQNGDDIHPQAVKAFPNGSLASATATDKSRWEGFCEIESEPAFFNVMLRDFGVKGVKVQEVFSLDDENLAFLPRPIYGLTFLYRWREDDPEKQEATCPEGVWFANQTVNHACATVALLNIVNNIEGVELGQHLEQFKDFTSSFTPALRGDAIGNFEYIKKMHNSFARKMDMLNIDLQLKNDATLKKGKARRGATPDDDSENAFHFIAFVPVAGKVWKLDGLERQPRSLGTYEDGEWLDLAKPFMVSRMAEYEQDQIEFSLLSLVHDPLQRLKSQLACNVKTTRYIDQLLQTRPDAKQDCAPRLAKVHLEAGLSDEDIDAVPTPDDVIQDLAGRTTEDLQSHQAKQVTMQAELRTSLWEEEQARSADEKRAASRRHDYGPAIHAWAKMLARKKMVETLLKS